MWFGLTLALINSSICGESYGEGETSWPYLADTACPVVLTPFSLVLSSVHSSHLNALRTLPGACS